jgi:integrase
MSAPTPSDRSGHSRPPANMSGNRSRRPLRTKGRRYPPDPPRPEEIIAVMRCCSDGLHGLRARGLIAVLWRSGLRVQEALDLAELDLDRRRGSLLVRRGKGGRRREVGTVARSAGEHPRELRDGAALRVRPRRAMGDRTSDH